MSTECPHGDEYGPAFACPACSPRDVNLDDASDPFDARFESECGGCPDLITQGDRIVMADGRPFHVNCTT